MLCSVWLSAKDLCCLCFKALFFGLRVSILNMSTTDVRRDQVSCDQSSRAFDLANAASA